MGLASGQTQIILPKGSKLPTEADFDATAVTLTSVNKLDQSTFDTISFHGSRCNFDEIRLGTQFDDVVNGTEVGGGGGAPSFAISDLVRDPATGHVTITWRSRPGVSYAIDATGDLEGGWEELDDGLPGAAEAEETSYIELADGSTSLEIDTQKRFYRVRAAP